ncbi:MAG: hypothetical protein KF724_09700 [Phycisphaeraceae bacterium]|nr:hypothetical protein [Phycisphaeraceae bacterium]
MTPASVEVSRAGASAIRAAKARPVLHAAEQGLDEMPIEATPGSGSTGTSPRSDASPPDLPDLLRVFNEVSSRLSETHRRLEERVAGLQRELEEARDGLRRSRALAGLGEMAAGIAHEIRNPLASIALHAEVLREDLADRPEQCEVLDKIARAITRLDSIVGGVLRFARSARSATRSALVIESVQEALAACSAEIESEGASVEVRVPSELEVSGDLESIVQALVNLVRNAVEAIVAAGHDGGSIRIDAGMRERLGADGCRTPMICIAVEDSGTGFDPAIMDRVFTPFVTTRASGTGLGLAIVHRIADAHGGAVRIERSSLGGARVELLLPRCGEQQSGDDPRSESWAA